MSAAAKPTPTGADRARPAPEPLAWLGWFRAAAIVGVVMIHVTGLTAVKGLTEPSPVGEWAATLDFLSRWSVPGFVMASGAMLLDPSRFRGTGHFLRRRASRLVPPLIFWHVVYALWVTYLHSAFDPAAMLAAAAVGKLYTALYFFWIVLGLALVAPVLVPWVGTVRAREVGVAGALLTAMSALTMALLPVAPAGEQWVRTALTWWIPYLGYFLLGYALRRAALTVAGAGLALAGVIAGTAWLLWQWGSTTGLAGVLEQYQPADSYFHPGVAISTCGALYLARYTIRPGGPLGVLARPTAADIGRRLGGSTLGVYGVHQLVLAVAERAPLIGGGPLASSPAELVARAVVVVVLSYAFALTAARVPLLNRVV